MRGVTRGPVSALEILSAIVQFFSGTELTVAGI
jgi:hypothetical protein